MLKIVLPVLSGLLCVACAAGPHQLAGEMPRYALDDAAHVQAVGWQTADIRQASITSR